MTSNASRRRGGMFRDCYCPRAALSGAKRDDLQESGANSHVPMTIKERDCEDSCYRCVVRLQGSHAGVPSSH